MKARSFLEEDLVDELFIGLGLILLGDGIPGFPGVAGHRFTSCSVGRQTASQLSADR